MTREYYRDVAKSNRIICRNGYYAYYDYNVPFPLDYKSVDAFSPERLQEIVDDLDDFWEKSFCGSKGAKITLLNKDSFEAAKTLRDPLVMNFANPYHPGGGYFNGAQGQEEILCRRSTLYASIASHGAQEMYQLNQECKPHELDYMLLSPHVYVFRDIDGQFLKEPDHVSVMTVAAPNRKKSDDSSQKILSIMEDRLRFFFLASARMGYRSLVLGAWGCGAFGNDTKEVAKIFYTLLFEEGFHEFFDEICFAIYQDSEKYKIFQDVFGDKIIYNDVARWDNHTINIVKKVAFECLDHYSHLYSDGALIDDYNYIIKDDVYYLDPWQGIHYEKIEDPWDFFGQEKMDQYVRSVIHDNPRYFKNDKTLKINDLYNQEKLSYYSFEKKGLKQLIKFASAFSKEEIKQYYYSREAQQEIYDKYNSYLKDEYDREQSLEALTSCLRLMLE